MVSRRDVKATANMTAVGQRCRGAVSTAAARRRRKGLSRLGAAPRRVPPAGHQPPDRPLICTSFRRLAYVSIYCSRLLQFPVLANATRAVRGA